MSDYDIKFLESHANLKGVLTRSIGRKPSAKVVNDISVCLQQGRLFFEAANSAPMQIKPLQVYYGVAAYSAAVVLARRFLVIENLKQSHGLSDITPKNACLEDLQLRVEKDGLFQSFNDTVAQLGRVWSLNSAVPSWRPYHFSSADLIAGTQISFRDIFSRAPELELLYRQTFDEMANSLPIYLYSFHNDKIVELHTFTKYIFQDLDDLHRMVRALREKYPFLLDWQLTGGMIVSGSTRVAFQNIRFLNPDDENNRLIQTGEKEFTLASFSDSEIIEYWDIIPPLTGGITNTYTYVIRPVASFMPSEYAIYFLGSFLLSSLVRYHPQIWQKAISKSYTNGVAPDDRCLALIDDFLSKVLARFPSFVVHCIEHNETDKERPISA